jgi:3-isopropylmalate/(R)-2-methylmalate dehydratase large subunit
LGAERLTRPLTLFDRLWDAHVVANLGGGSALVAIDRVLLHERTGAAALNALAAAGRTPLDASRVFAMIDHIVDTRPGRGDETTMAGGTAFIRETRAACRAAGIRLFDIDDPQQGIMHVVSPELGIVQPGMTIIAPDSHTCTQGAIGAFALGIGTSETEHAIATGTLRLSRPKNMRVTLTGRTSPMVGAKDLALAIIAAHGSAGGRDHVIEYQGETIASMTIEARMTLCNMATEFSAISAIIAPDMPLTEWLAGRPFAPTGKAWDQALVYWQSLTTDRDATFDRELFIDASTVAPMVSWGTSPSASSGIDSAVPNTADRAMLDYMALEPGLPLEGLPVDAAFIGSCTNARLSDLEGAAAVIKGRHIAPGLTAIVVPGSMSVRRAAEAAGLDRIFIDAGFEWRLAGCSSCFYAGGDSFGPGARVISSTNRNFVGRQGPGVRTHIASPVTVAASALAGAIADPRKVRHG